MNDLRSVGRFADSWVCRGRALLTQFWALTSSALYDTDGFKYGGAYPRGRTKKR